MATDPDGHTSADPGTAAAWRAVVDALGYGTCVVDARGTVVHANAEAVRLLDVAPVGRRLWDVVRIVGQPGPGDGHRMLAPLGRDDVAATIAGGRSHRRDDVLFIVPGGRAFPGRCVLAPAALPDGTTVAVLSFLDDTGRREFVEELEHLAGHDPLTGLPNRLLLLERLAQAVARAERTGSPLAVLFCDLDGFKAVNDVHGHAVGDVLLVEAAQRLRRSVRPADTVARLGGDEFVVLCEDLADADAARTLADRIVTALERPFGLAGVGTASLSSSIGIALATVPGESGERLLRAADSAMYQAKESGPGRVVVAARRARRGDAMTRRARVLVVEDDAPVALVVARALEGDGCEVEIVVTGDVALERATVADFDVIVLDVGIPAPDGLDVCRALRRDERWTPILLLTARDSVEDRVAGLDAGADDYVVKPFSIPELRARVRALSRRSGRDRASPLVVGDLWLDPVARVVRRGDAEISLSPREFALLEVLMRHPGRAVPRNHIVTEVWRHGSPTTSNVVDVYVRYLREKVDRPYRRHTIETVRGEGYRVVDDTAT